MSGRRCLCITSPSFSQNAQLVKHAGRLAATIRINREGRRLSGSELASFIGEADGAIIGLELVDAPLLESCKNLKVVAKYGVGVDNIDFEACAKRSVSVLTSQGVNRRSVAEHALCLMLMLAHNINRSYPLLKQGIWHKKGGAELSSKTIGIIGLGHTGKELARLLAPFGASVLYFDIERQLQSEQSLAVRFVELDTLLSASDFISVHVSLNPTSVSLLSRSALQRMKPTAFLVNTARSQVVDQDALFDLLASGQLSGAALDVFDVEPPTDSRIRELDSLICTPHVAGNTSEAVLAMGMSAVVNLATFWANDLNG